MLLWSATTSSSGLPSCKGGLGPSTYQGMRGGGSWSHPRDPRSPSLPSGGIPGPSQVVPHRQPQSPGVLCHPARCPGWQRPAPEPCCAPGHCSGPHTRQRGSGGRQGDSGDGTAPWWPSTHLTQAGDGAATGVEASPGRCHDRKRDGHPNHPASLWIGKCPSGTGRTDKTPQ